MYLDGEIKLTMDVKEKAKRILEYRKAKLDLDDIMIPLEKAELGGLKMVTCVTASEFMQANPGLFK